MPRLGTNELALLVAIALAAEQTPVTVDSSGVDPLAGLSAEQVRYIRDRSQTRYIRGGRRAGKTVAIVRDLVVAMIGKPGHRAAYISLTRVLAKRAIWNPLKKTLGELGISYQAKETDLEIILEGGGTIMLGGAADSDDLDRYRSLHYDLVVIDECGQQRDAHLRTLIDDILEPAMMDYGGRLTLAGTPGYVLRGLWYEKTGPRRSSTEPVYHWTIRDNPLFAGRAEAVLAAIRKKKNWAKDSITYRREYEGEWVQDAGVLVYPFDAARNGVVLLPTHTLEGWPLSPAGWKFGLGLDVGYVHSSAFVVVACHRALPHSFVCHAEKQTELLTSGVRATAKRLREMPYDAGPPLIKGPWPFPVRFPDMAAIVDSGGMGKVHAETMRRRDFGMALHAAEKTEKASAIRDFRDRLIDGFVRVLEGAAEPLLDEWDVLGWNEDEDGHEDGGEDHASDACLYADRNLRHWRWDPESERPKPKYGTPEWYEQEERAAIAREEAEAMNEEERASWLR